MGLKSIRIILVAYLIYLVIAPVEVLSDEGDSTNAAAEVISIRGIGQFRPQAVDPWRNAKVEQDLFTGNFVRTGDYSRMGLLFSDRTQIRLNEKTIMRIKEVRVPSQGKGSTLLNLTRGRIWSQSKSIPSGLIMETPSATAAIRGTQWELSVDDRGNTILTVLTGEVEFYNDFGRLVVEANEQAIAKVGKAPVKILLVDSRERVQWVTAYRIDPLRHIVLHSENLESLKSNLRTLSKDEPVGQVARGAILADLGRWDEAEAEFKAVLEKEPKNTRAIIGLGFAALSKGNLKEAGIFFGRVARRAKYYDAELLRLGRVSVSILSNDLRSAVDNLNSIVKRRKLKRPTAYLILSDIMIYSGDIAAAVETVESGLKRFPSSARLNAQLSRIYLLADRLEQSGREADNALVKDAASIEGILIKGDIARIEGQGEVARDLYNQAASLKPAEDRAWYGLGVVNTEREEVRAGRRNLHQALEINPDGPGYQGQLGTLETFANEFNEAEESYRSALESNPDDYVALTGLGILELKRGNTQLGLDSFLRAEILEPRYARVQMYKGIAYYQLGRVKDALEALNLAGELDDKDPMPHIIASVIYTDLLRSDEGINEARIALNLMPYLKSLNQLANDQQGAANLGKSFAFQGLDEWSRSYAQESYYPFWAGSHLFLADVGYDGLFTKNSELFQGFLSDPTLFGASPRFQTILPKPGNHAVASLRVTQSEDFSGTSPLIAVNGFNNDGIPFAYNLSYENFDLDFDGLPFETDRFTAAIGTSPNHATGLFVFADQTDLFSEIRESRSDATSVTDFNLKDNRTTQRLDLGLHYKLSPQSQLWLKAGNFSSEDTIEGDIISRGSSISGGLARSDVSVDQPEFSLRHTFQLLGNHEISWGIELADRDTESFFFNEVTPGSGAFTSDFDFSEESSDFYVSDRFRVSDQLALQADLYLIEHEREANYIDSITLPPIPPFTQTTGQRFTKDGVFPRLGLVYRFAPNQLVRLAYQEWVRPSGFSSLGQVATAGIPLDDRLVIRGGELNRLRGQVEWEWSPTTFTQAFVDVKEIDNDLFELTPFTVSELDDLVKLRQRDLGSLLRGDLLEFVNIPEYEGGDIVNLGLAINHRLGSGLGLLGRYEFTDSENNGTVNKGKLVPFLPEHAAALGATWASPDGWYFVTRFVYRTERFSDAANLTPLIASWDGAVDLYKESADKRWLLRFSVDDMADKNQHTQYTAELSARF